MIKTLRYKSIDTGDYVRVFGLQPFCQHRHLLLESVKAVSV